MDLRTFRAQQALKHGGPHLILCYGAANRARAECDDLRRRKTGRSEQDADD
jgi:hypothetical protein